MMLILMVKTYVMIYGIVKPIFRLWIEEQWENRLNVVGLVIDMCLIEYDALGD